MNHATTRRFSHAAIILLLFTCCKDELPTQSDIVFPPSNVSYIAHIEPLFTTRCLSCHNAAPLDLTPPSYLNLMNYSRVQLVVPYVAASSYLVQLLEGTAQPVMPPTGERLTQNQIDGIKSWINEGAQNN